MPRRTVVMLIVGLTDHAVGDHTPRLRGFRERCEARRVVPPLPAVTCTAQSAFLTGRPASDHGIVANGWYDRASCEIRFWKQSNGLVDAEKVWETARGRDPSITCAKLFWWYNMYASVDVAVTPRPQYRADGRKIPDCHSRPPDLRDRLQAELGPFPLFRFWGPGASIESSSWIAESAMRVERWSRPTLTLVYLPHLDYAHQRFGPDAPESRAAEAEIDAVFGRLLDAYDDAGVTPIVLSEYGISPVDRPVHPNRALREAGLLAVRAEGGREHLDPGASAAFAVADHQVAHVYVGDPGRVEAASDVLGSLPGVERVLGRADLAAAGLDHPRSGDLVLVADAGAWFTYYHWLDDARAPDFARTVDIHRKPGYDPVELFLDPSIRFPRLAVARRLAMRRAGLRTLMDVIPLDATLVRGSHARVERDPARMPVLWTQAPTRARPEAVDATEIRDVILEHLFGV